MSTNNMIPQASPLLALPGELQNRIYDLVIPRNTTIILRADCGVTAASLHRDRQTPPTEPTASSATSLRYRYHPAPPPILAVCRDLRAETLGLYYGLNAFFASESMALPRAFEGFAVARALGAGHIRQFRLLHLAETHFAHSKRGERYDPLSGTFQTFETVGDGNKTYRIAFWVSLEGNEIKISRLRVTDQKAMEYECGEEPGLCCCTLESMVRGHDPFAATTGKPLLEIVVKYCNLVSEHTTLVHVRKDQGEMAAPSVGAKLCLKCRKVKSI